MATIQQNAVDVPNEPNQVSLTVTELVRDCKLVELWNKAENGEAKEEDSDEEGAAGVLEIVLRPEEDFNQNYSHADGLGCLPRAPAVTETTRLSGPASVGKAEMAGKYEDSMRSALKVERTRKLETVSEELRWDPQGQVQYGKFFRGWEPLVQYNLPLSKDLVQRVLSENQKRWDAATIEVSVMGNGGRVESFFGIIRHWFTPTDWLSLYRADSRTIYSWGGRDTTKPDDLKILENQDHHLFDTTKYSGDTEFMTILTYGRGHNGTASLFRVNLTPAKKEKPSLAASLDILAYEKDIPRAILRGMKNDCRIELVQKGGKVRCLRGGGQFQASPVQVCSTKTNKKGQKVSTPWEEIGDGWRRALGIAVESEDDDGLVATIPQMMALLHLKGYALHNLHSTPVQEFATPLVSVPFEDDPKKSNPGWEIKRGLKIISGPDRDGHDGDRVKVIVLFPTDSNWAKEMLLWG